jgi:protein TonB
VAAACSLLLHLCLLSGVLLAKRFVPYIVVKKGEPIVVELQNPEEFAPRGNPARPLSPFPSTRPEAPKAQAPPRPKAEVRPAPPALKPVPPAPKAPPAAPEPAVAKAQPAESEGTKPPPPAPPKAATQPEPAAPPREEPGSAGGVQRQAALPPDSRREPGGGGGLRGGRGGIEGEPIPLDTKDPRYTDYFDKIRHQIRRNWIYPREAGERGIGGQLIIEFVIAKDGHLSVIELRRSSGVEILDRFALNAVKLAQPFPPVPDSVAKAALSIAGIFTYQIVDSGLLNNFLR